MRPLITFLLVLAPVVFITGCDQLRGESTVYAKGYSSESFRSIKVGMTTQSVADILGPPLSKTTQEWDEVWSYMPQRTGPTGSVKSMEFNLFGRVTNLRFASSGIVISASGDYLSGTFTNTTKEEVVRQFGQPIKVDRREFEVILHYSQPGSSGNGTYKRREIHFDASNRVVSVVSAIYYD